MLQEIAALGGELVRLDALVARCFGHNVGGKGFQHHLELKRGCVGFQFLEYEISLPLVVQSISHVSWFPL